ncbi:MAG: glycosyltransferase family 2 protein [Bacteroidales bacterium]|nr:glycosyltransferase family 2 protein [Bacteroidales bacterium]MDD4669737.1 glycosyltransferase family 2 protein [Bacteroidales bacterium]
MDVAVVILNWNGKKFLEEYLPVLVKNTESSNYFIVIADNASTDGSQEWLEAHFPQIELLQFDKNYGFTGGYNRAFNEIDADYYVLLNSDIEVTPLWLDHLFNFMEEAPNVGICQPKILSMHDKHSFEYAGAAGGFIDRYGYPFCRGRILSKIEKDEGQYDEPMETFWATGACLMIRSSLYHHLGGLDENFFAHMEEIDLCWRAKLLGYEVWCVPSSVIYHVGGGTLPNNSPQKLYLNYRNNLLMLYKNLPEKIRGRRLFVRRCLDGASAMVYLFTGKWSFFKSVLRAHSDYSKMKREMDPSPFSEEKNNRGYYSGSIVAKFFLSRGKLTFRQLRQF